MSKHKPDEPAPHPWYGPCDAFGPDGECSECCGKVAHKDDDDEPAPERPCSMCDYLNARVADLSIAYGESAYRIERASEIAREIHVGFRRTEAHEMLAELRRILDSKEMLKPDEPAPEQGGE